GDRESLTRQIGDLIYFVASQAGESPFKPRALGASFRQFSGFSRCGGGANGSSLARPQWDGAVTFALRHGWRDKRRSAGSWCSGAEGRKGGGVLVEYWCESLVPQGRFGVQCLISLTTSARMRIRRS